MPRSPLTARPTPAPARVVITPERREEPSIQAIEEASRDVAKVLSQGTTAAAILSRIKSAG